MFLVAKSTHNTSSTQHRSTKVSCEEDSPCLLPTAQQLRHFRRSRRFMLAHGAHGLLEDMM